MGARKPLPGTLYWQGHHRKPPMPKVPKGHCKWCGEPILWGPAHATKAGQPNTRRSWHAECVKLYKIAAWSAEQRLAIRRRGDTHCVACRTPCRAPQRGTLPYMTWETTTVLADWEADHRIPLWKAPRQMTMAQRDAFFGIGNLQLLCVPCHKLKSRAEAAERAGIV